METGTVIEFESLTCAVYVVTEEVDISIVTIDNPWNDPGDEVKLTTQFTITPEQINNTGWEFYMAEFYYQINQSTIVDGGGRVNHMTSLKGPYVLNMSTEQLAVLWPYPPIFLMMFIYWGLFVGLRKFNRRYDGLKETTSVQPVEVTPPPDDNSGY
ncbi:MAG: hypothetical protein ACW987_03430 [Candidatus Thorarchaeota archaeon]